jgi:hypothetical protein
VECPKELYETYLKHVKYKNFPLVRTAPGKTSFSFCAWTRCVQYIYTLRRLGKKIGSGNIHLAREYRAVLVCFDKV